MDSARFWNTVRGREDWDRTHDLWNVGSMRVIDYVPDQYHYAMGDASRAYSPRKLRRFTREIVYVPGPDVFFVFDRVVSQNPTFRKAWLLHGVNQPSVDQNARTFRFNDGAGEVTVHSLPPRDADITPRGGLGNEFYTPGDAQGGQWGSGQNWPSEPPQGGPLPDDPELRHMWKTFGATIFPRFLVPTTRMLCPGLGGWKFRPANLLRRISSSTFSKSVIKE